MSAAQVVEAYFGRMNNGDPAVADLFHHDAVLRGLGTETIGRPAIDEFYERSISAASPRPTLIGKLLVGGERVAAEIEIALAGMAPLHVIDLFEIEDDLIRSLSYFLCDHGTG